MPHTDLRTEEFVVPRGKHPSNWQIAATARLQWVAWILVGLAILLPDPDWWARVALATASVAIYAMTYLAGWHGGASWAFQRVSDEIERDMARRGFLN
ncbi:MAG: hypothetical protein M3O70_08740 [Actinomycetota bacterium]|nr:hypothetical protein [Actinomycetota bacterium]